MYTEIKPIETIYKGYKFRSRLEARWAVFFDLAGISYQYEPEGFILKDGTQYLPDFYLDKFQVFVEIKPIIPYEDKNREKWEDKCKMFSETTGKSIFLTYGDPAEDIWGYLFAFTKYNDGIGSHMFDARIAPLMIYDKGSIAPKVMILCGGSFNQPDDELYSEVVIDVQGNKNKYVNGGYELMEHWKEHSLSVLENAIFHRINEDNVMVDWGKLDTARIAARQARFEYGENPKTCH